MAKFKWLRKHSSTLLLYAMIFGCVLLLNRSSVLKVINPFGFAFCFAMIYLGRNAVAVASFYFATFLLFNMSFEGLVISLSAVAVMLLLYLVFKLIKKKINVVCTYICLLLSQAGYVYFHLFSGLEVMRTVAMLVVALLFCYVCICAFSAIFSRGISGRFTLDEHICLGLFMVALFSGLFGIYAWGVNVSSFIMVLALLIISRTFTFSTTISVALLYGFGAAFATASVKEMAIFVTFATLMATLKDRPKLLAPIMVVIADLVFGLFLSAYATYTYISVIPIGLAGIVYMFLPRRLFDLVAGYSYAYDGSLAEEYILLGQAQGLKKNLVRTSNCFLDLKTCYQRLSVGELGRQGAGEALAQDLVGKVCGACYKYNSCSAHERLMKDIEKLMDFALEKGRVSFIDASNLLTTSCSSLGALIEEANSLAQAYFEYESTLKTNDQSKMMLAKQCEATGQMLRDMAAQGLGEEKNNASRSRELLDELTLNGILVSEARVLEGEDGIHRVILIVQNRDVLSPRILSCLKSVLRLDFALSARQPTRLAGWNVLCFAPSQRYSVLIGFSSSAQEGKVSGDAHSCLKLPQGKELFAICDGMGHGQKASQISTAALGLIENFYRAGFKDDVVAKSINQVLLGAGDNFSCLDACVIDTLDATAEFIKMGASVSVIKRAEGCQIVEAESLPLGAVPMVKISAKKEVLREEDIIVLASDGVVDRFLSVEEYANFINNEVSASPPLLAASILDEAAARPTDHPDDMTVLVLKVVRK